MKRDRLIIKRPWKDILIPAKNILDCRQLTEADMNGISRTSGVGGLFGYAGNYHNNTIGEMKFYATRFNNLVLLHISTGESIILSPDKPKEMINEIMSDITINN